MPEPKPNDPYSRPINATRATAVPLLGYWGQKDTSKARNAAAGPVDASQVRALPSVVLGYPCDVEPEKPKTTRKPKAATPSPEPTSPNSDVTSPSDEPAGVTE